MDIGHYNDIDDILWAMEDEETKARDEHYMLTGYGADETDNSDDDPENDIPPITLYVTAKCNEILDRLERI